MFKLYFFDNRGNACFKCHRKISTIFTDHFSSYCAGLFESHAQSPFGLNKLSARLDRSRVMSGKVKQKSSATAADSSTQSINEKILKECHTLYIDPDNGELIFFLFCKGRRFEYYPCNFTRAWAGEFPSFHSFIADSALFTFLDNYQ